MSEPTPVTKPTPTIGKIVHYVLEKGPCRGEHRPAVIVKTWENYEGVNLQIFTDGLNDATTTDMEFATGVCWRTSVHRDEDVKALGTWHSWPEL